MNKSYWWKVSYDFQTWNWAAFGRVAFVRAIDISEAKSRADALLARIRPGADIVRLEITPSDWASRLKFWRLVQFNIVWKRNVSDGVPNMKSALWRSRP